MKAWILWIAAFLVLSAGVQSGVYPQSPACRADDFNTCSSEDLLNLVSNTLDNDSSPNIDLVDKIKVELIKRKAADPTYKFFSKTEYLGDLNWAYMVLSALRNRHVDDLLKPSATDDLTLRAYFANLYFAKVGGKFALNNLNKNYFKYAMSSADWIVVVELFGKYKYYPAKANLILTINAANPDLAEASLDSLELLYPETKASADKMYSPENLQAFYSEYIKAH